MGRKQFPCEGTGRTPHRSIRGKDYTGEVVPFGEVCLGRNHSEDGARLNMRWMRGVVVGKLDRTDECLLLTPTGAMKTRCVRRLEGDKAWDLQFLNLCEQGARSRHQQKDELESGRRAKIVYLRQNILDKYGRAAGCPGCVGIGQHTEECRARIEHEMNKGGAIMLETSGNQEEIVPELDVNLKKTKIGEPDINPGGASSLTADTPKRGESEQGSSAGNENLLAGCIAAVNKLLCDTPSVDLSRDRSALSGKFPEDELKAGRELKLRNMLKFSTHLNWWRSFFQESTLMTWCGLMNREVTELCHDSVCDSSRPRGSEKICLRERQIRFSSSICWPRLRVARISDCSSLTLVLHLRTLEQMRKFM